MMKSFLFGRLSETSEPLDYQSGLMNTIQNKKRESRMNAQGMLKTCPISDRYSGKSSSTTEDVVSQLLCDEYWSVGRSVGWLVGWLVG